jgi:hypothetical protein
MEKTNWQMNVGTGEWEEKFEVPLHFSRRWMNLDSRAHAYHNEFSAGLTPAQLPLACTIPKK